MSSSPLIVVAGASGFLGTNLVLRLSDEGYAVRAVYNRRVPFWLEGKADLVQADLRDPQACARVCDGADSVFMCAAVTSGAAMIKTTPLIHVTPNVVMNAQMLEAAHGAGARKFVFISSAAAYPPTGSRPVTEDEMFDADPFPAYYTAGWMKRYAEILCRTYAEKIANPMATVVVRPSNVYGPYDKFGFGTSHVTAAQIRKVVERHHPIEVWGTGEDVRDLIYVDDFIEGLMRAWRHDSQHLVVNIGSGCGVRVLDIIQAAMAADGYDAAQLRLDPSKPSTIPILLMDVSRARSVLGFTAETTLQEGMGWTIAWLKTHSQKIWDR